MVGFRIPTDEERSSFLDRFREELGGSEQSALDHLGMTWEDLAKLFWTLGEVRCVCCDGEVAGFVWIEAREEKLHVHAIILLPEFRGKGIGGDVLCKLDQEFAGTARIIELGVQEGNTSAIRFYKKHGFHCASTNSAPGFLVLRKSIVRRNDSSTDCRGNSAHN